MPAKPNLLDKLINLVDPKAGAERMRYRYAQDFMTKQVRKYEGAAHGRRTSGWVATGSSAPAEIQNALMVLRNRSREQVRNNPYAKNAIREIKNNVVGTGIMPKPMGLSSPQEKKLKAAWKLWADSTDCDYDGHLTYYGIQALVTRCVAQDGEVIVRKRIVNDKSLAVPLQLQVLEADYIDGTKFITETDTGGYIYYGVEFSKENKIVAYWLWNNHPGDNMQYATHSSRIPAEELIHVFEKERPGQFRGVPFGHTSMLRLNDLSDYEDAQLIRQKIAACFTVFITDSGTTGPLNTPNDDVPLEKVEPGIIERLSPGKTVTFATPPDAGQTYDPYVKTVLRAVASGYGMDYVTLTGDLTAVNFSSGRMGWLKFHRNVTDWQWNMIIPMFCNISWQWFIQFANIMGHVRADKVGANWTPPRREMIDPTREVTAIKEAIRSGLQTWQEAVRENGNDPDEQIEEMIKASKLFDAAELMPECDPRFDPRRILASKAEVDDSGTPDATPPAKGAKPPVKK